MTAVLVLDDEAPIRHSLRRLLRREGYEARLAESPAVADAALDEAVAVIVCDHDLGAGAGTTGADYLRSCRERWPAVSGILFSGHVEVVEIARAQRGGGLRFVPKPWSDEELLLAVRQGCERWRLLTAASGDQRVLDRLPLAAVGCDERGRLVLANLLARQVFAGLGDLGGDASGLPQAIRDLLTGPVGTVATIQVGAAGTWSFARQATGASLRLVTGHPLPGSYGDLLCSTT